MKLIAYLAMALSVILGTISAATAYMVPLSRGAQALDGLRLAAPAGAYDPTLDSGPALTESINAIRAAQAQRRAEQAPDATPLVVREPVVVDLPPVPQVQTAPTPAQTVAAMGRLSPIARPGDDLDQAMIALLSDQGVRYVKVQSFTPAIWLTMWQSWVFLFAVLLLAGSAMVARSASRSAGSALTIQADDPVQVTARMAQAVQKLADELPSIPDQQQRLHLFVSRLGAVQRDDVPAFVATRPELITRFGLSGFAEIMDVFAAMERQVNRAWSAAADGVEEEAADALANALAMLPELSNRVAASPARS